MRECEKYHAVIAGMRVYGATPRLLSQAEVEVLNSTGGENRRGWSPWYDMRRMADNNHLLYAKRPEDMEVWMYGDGRDFMIARVRESAGGLYSPKCSQGTYVDMKVTGDAILPFFSRVISAKIAIRPNNANSPAGEFRCSCVPKATLRGLPIAWLGAKAGAHVLVPTAGYKAKPLLVEHIQVPEGAEVCEALSDLAGTQEYIEQLANKLHAIGFYVTKVTYGENTGKYYIAEMMQYSPSKYSESALKMGEFGDAKKLVFQWGHASTDDYGVFIDFKDIKKIKGEGLSRVISYDGKLRVSLVGLSSGRCALSENIVPAREIMVRLPGKQRAHYYIPDCEINYSDSDKTLLIPSSGSVNRYVFFSKLAADALGAKYIPETKHYHTPIGAAVTQEYWDSAPLLDDVYRECARLCERCEGAAGIQDTIRSYLKGGYDVEPLQKFLKRCGEIKSGSRILIDVDSGITSSILCRFAQFIKAQNTREYLRNDYKPDGCFTKLVKIFMKSPGADCLHIPCGDTSLFAVTVTTEYYNSAAWVMEGYEASTTLYPLLNLIPGILSLPKRGWEAAILAAKLK